MNVRFLLIVIKIGVEIMSDCFPVLILNARPAAGKSELIQYLLQCPVEERIERFHIGTIQSIDDFPMLWAWMEEDDLLEKQLQLPRLHTRSDGYFLRHDYWNLLIHRINLEYEKLLNEEAQVQTVIIEFSRGAEHGGYQTAFSHLSKSILERAASLYIQVSFEESSRKNQQRYNPQRPYSILEHGLSIEKLERLYRHDDWLSFTAPDPKYIRIGEQLVPYAIFENEDDLTTRGGKELELRLEKTLQQLWNSWLAKGH